MREYNPANEIRKELRERIIKAHIDNPGCSMQMIADICGCGISKVNNSITAYYKKKMSEVNSKPESERRLPPAVPKLPMSDNEDDYAIHFTGFSNIKWVLENLDLTIEDEDGSRPICVGDLIKTKEHE